MKLKALTLALSVCLPLAAFADTYSGTITETVTSTDDPNYAVGDVFTGSYSYMSSTGADGNFYALSSWNQTFPNMSLTGQIYTFNSFPGDQGIYGDQTSSPELTVENGVVTSFIIDDSSVGYGEISFDANFTFASADGTPMPNIDTFPTTDGTFAFSSPVDVSLAVPDRPNAALLVGASFGALILFRARRRSRFSPVSVR